MKAEGVGNGKVANTSWIKCLIITRLNFGFTVQADRLKVADIQRLSFFDILFTDTTERENRLFEALDEVRPDGNDWSTRCAANSAQEYKLELMKRCRSAEEQIRFMYDNVTNPVFRRKLIQAAWDKADYSEVLKLAKDGINHDAELAGLVGEWHEWEYKAYQEIGDKNSKL